MTVHRVMLKGDDMVATAKCENCSWTAKFWDVGDAGGPWQRVVQASDQHIDHMEVLDSCGALPRGLTWAHDPGNPLKMTSNGPYNPEDPHPIKPKFPVHELQELYTRAQMEEIYWQGNRNGQDFTFDLIRKHEREAEKDKDVMADPNAESPKRTFIDKILRRF